MVTYESGGHKTMIDYILVKKEEKVKDVKAIPGEETMMQHRLIVMDVFFKRTVQEDKKKLKQVKTWRLKEERIQKILRERESKSCNHSRYAVG